jgi:hypothetical protein
MRKIIFEICFDGYYSITERSVRLVYRKQVIFAYRHYMNRTGNLKSSTFATVTYIQSHSLKIILVSNNSEDNLCLFEKIGKG